MIFCVGAINVDFIFMSQRWPAEHEKLRAEDYVCVGGGSAANTAVELSMLGREVSIVGSVGTDDLGDFALRGLVKTGVNVDHVVRRDGWKTGCAAIRSVGGSKSILTAGTRDAYPVFNSLAALEIQPGDHVHFSWALPESLHDRLRQWRRTGVSLSWETDGRMSMSAAELFDIIFMNADERSMYESSGALTNDWLNSSRHGVTVVVTLANIGAEAYLNGRRYFCGASEVQVVDRTGGGDAFDSGFLSAWLDRRSLDVCLKCGLESAAVIIGQLGPQRRIPDLIQEAE
jgi:sugar/nucleoside kinase (ribokinase family)